MRTGTKEHVHIACRYFSFLAYFAPISCTCCSTGLRTFVTANWTNNHDKNSVRNSLQDAKHKVGSCKHFKFLKQPINVSLEHIFKLSFK